MYVQELVTLALLSSHPKTSGILSYRGSKMQERCVAAQCGNVKYTETGITMHKIPFYDETCPIKLKRRKKWINFVSARRKN